MGYTLSRLGKLPYDKDNEFYIFVIGNNAYKGGSLEKIVSNFDILAKDIGENNIIAKGLNGKEWTFEIATKYFKDIPQIHDYFPGILITNSHPDQFSEKSMRILISLKQVDDKFNNIDQFFDLLIDFVNKKDDRFLDYANKNISWLDIAVDGAHLKPNLMGIGINLNYFLGLFKKSKKPIIDN